MTVDHTQSSHHIIKSFEADQLKDRSGVILIADWLTSAFGSITFLIFNLVGFALWISINIGDFSFIPIFDPYPFILLTMCVSLEAIFLSIIVLMSQNKQGQVSNLREELDMQVNLIAEREITMTLKVLKLIAQKLDIKVSDHEFTEMTRETDFSYIETELKEQINKLNKTPVLPKISSEIISQPEKIMSKIKKTI